MLRLNSRNRKKVQIRINDLIYSLSDVFCQLLSENLGVKVNSTGVVKVFFALPAFE